MGDGLAITIRRKEEVSVQITIAAIGVRISEEALATKVVEDIVMVGSLATEVVTQGTEVVVFMLPLIYYTVLRIVTAGNVNIVDTVLANILDMVAIVTVSTVLQAVDPSVQDS